MVIKEGKAMDVILNYLVDKWPAFATIIITVAVTAVVVWFLSMLYHRFIKVEEKSKNLPCSKHDDLYHRFVKVEEKTDSLPCDRHKDIFYEIKEELVEIRAILSIKNPKLAIAFSQKDSPRELNEAGLLLFADINGEEFLERNKEIFFKDIDNKRPKTALDVEESAIEVLYAHIGDDMFIELKNWVYNSPNRKIIIDGIEKDYSITINDICFVLSLPLRNMYLGVRTLDR